MTTSVEHIRELDCDGSITWVDKAGRLDNPDGPSLMAVDGIIRWHKRGLQQRTSGYAGLWADGEIEWAYQGHIFAKIPHNIP